MDINFDWTVTRRVRVTELGKSWGHPLFLVIQREFSFGRFPSLSSVHTSNLTVRDGTNIPFLSQDAVFQTNECDFFATLGAVPDLEHTNFPHLMFNPVLICLYHLSNE